MNSSYRPRTYFRSLARILGPRWAGTRLGSPLPSFGTLGQSHSRKLLRFQYLGASCHECHAPCAAKYALSPLHHSDAVVGATSHGPCLSHVGGAGTQPCSSRTLPQWEDLPFVSLASLCCDLGSSGNGTGPSRRSVEEMSVDTSIAPCAALGKGMDVVHKGSDHFRLGGAKRPL